VGTGGSSGGTTEEARTKFQAVDKLKKCLTPQRGKNICLLCLSFCLWSLTRTQHTLTCVR